MYHRFQRYGGPNRKASHYFCCGAIFKTLSKIYAVGTEVDMDAEQKFCESGFGNTDTIGTYLRYVRYRTDKVVAESDL